MSKNTAYDPAQVENKWYQYWMEKKFFSAKVNPEKEPYTIVIPPPNVTGILHMGHMLNNTVQDILIRKARMEGKEACWVPGTDHASIATETKVVNKLSEEGIQKTDLTRDEFLDHAWEWKEKYGGIILQQLKKLGASCDWDRESFTMDPALSEEVINVFVKLHEKGLIYRGARMVNWDPKGQTALSDEEVNHKEVNSKLYHVSYKVVGGEDCLTIATTRPETILGDSAICIHPEDTRYTHLHGKKAIVPLVNREVPIILDEYVDMEFGTGCLKVTPAHDINDYELGIKHNLEVIDIISDNGTMSEAAQFFIGEDRFVVRKKIIKQLDEMGAFIEAKDITNNVGYSERTNEVIEPKISTQWFCKMEDLAKPALENVMNDTIKIHPPKFKNMYRSWMENIKDWCVSRQLWWGHRIPAYYLPNGQYVVAASLEAAFEKAKVIDPAVVIGDLKQDEDVLDTWFSSWLWPMSVFGKIDKSNEEFNYFFPTNDLVTGFDIIFFWVARMIMAGYEFGDDLPFKNVYITGMVRDEKGRKMSKQLGNSPDAIALMDKYSADGVRTGMLFAAPAGNDLLFDEKLCEQGRNFVTKLRNAFNLTQIWEVVDGENAENKVSAKWMETRINETLLEVEDAFSKYRISDALMSIYKLVNDDFCSWYLELIKPGFEQPIDRTTYNKTIELLETIVKLVHPFMPFITEELWHQIKERAELDCVIIAEWPKAGVVDEEILSDFEVARQAIGGIRNIRNTKQLGYKDELALKVKTNNSVLYQKFDSQIKKLAKLSSIEFVDTKVDGAVSFVITGDELFVPLDGLIDESEQKADIEKQLEYAKGSLAIVMKKLSNERFVSNAPEQVIASERKKQADAEAKIKALEESLAAMV